MTGIYIEQGQPHDSGALASNMSNYDQFIGTRPVASQHAFDEASLARYLRAHVEGFSGDLKVEQFKGGQSNPTFMLTAGGRRYVMRRKPSGVLQITPESLEGLLMNKPNAIPDGKKGNS